MRRPLLLRVSSTGPAAGMLLAGLAGLLLSGCGPPVPASREVAVRWIEEDPEALFDLGRLVREETVACRELGGEREGELAVVPEVAVGERAAGVRARSVRGTAAVRFTADLDAGAVDEIAIEVAGLRGTEATLRWAPPGREPGPGDEVVVPVVDLRGTALQRLEFPLAGHPGWSGPIGHLELSLRSRPGTTTSVRRLCALRRVLDPERVEASLGRPWRVDKGGDVRSALLVLPGRPLERTVEVPAGAVLRFAYGLTSEEPGPVTFRASVVLPEGRTEVVGERRLGPGASDPAGWAEAEIDLSAHGGERLRVILAARGPEEAGGRTLAAFAHPELLAPARPAPPRPNLVLVSIDTLRADHLSLYGYHRPTSPHLERRARERGVVFRHAVAQAPWTLPSHVSLFSGLDALRHGVNHDRPAPSRLVLLAERLRAAGWTTAAVTGGGYLHPDLGLAQGFDRYRYWLDPRAGAGELEAGVAAAVDWLGAVDARPFFLFFHTYETHTPLLPREPYLERLVGEPARSSEGIVQSRPVDRGPEAGFLGEQRFVLVEPGGGRREIPLPPELRDLPVDLYDASIAYTDDRLEALFRALEAQDLLERTVVVVTSDHGEALGEHGLWGHHYLTDDNLLVPLVFFLPGGRGAGRTIDEQVRSVDVLPTLLELLGLETPAGLDGVSLAPFFDGRPAPVPEEAWSYAARSNRGIALRLGNRLKYILFDAVWPALAGRETLYRLDADPGELADRAAWDPSTPELRRAVRRAFGERIEGLRIGLANGGERTISGTIGGAAVTPGGVKSVDRLEAAVAWERAGLISVRLLPGRSFSLDFTHRRPGDLVLDLAVEGLGDSARLEETLDPAHLDRPLALGFDGSSWTAGVGDPPPATGLFVERRGAVADDAVSSPTAESLRAQLEALGYVE